MKKTFTININGLIYNIEEDAYDLLHNYLLNLKKHFGDNEEGREILTDIEARISEIFSEKISGDTKVITYEYVEEIIKTMGTPEDFAEEAGEEEDIRHSGKKGQKRLYRDPEHRIFGGVCGGLGAYFNMDPVIVRIIFVILTFVTTGTGLLAYIILWIAVPKAITTAQRLEMYGREATVKNIEKSIREEINEVKKNYDKFKGSDTNAKIKKSVNKAGEASYNVFRVIFKLAVTVLGAVLIISGFFGLLGMISSAIIGYSFVQDWPLVWSPELRIPEFLNYFIDPDAVTPGIIAVGILAGIPLLAMLYIGSKLLFRYKSNNVAICLSMTGLWLLALLFLVVISTSQAFNYKNRSSVVITSNMKCDSCQTLYLNLADALYENYIKTDWDIDNFKIAEKDGVTFLIGNPKLNIEKASGNSFIVTVKKVARGRSPENAREMAEDIIYTFEERDSLLIFEPNFVIDKNQKWRNQEVKITVKVPEYKSVYLDEKMTAIIYDIENVTNTWDKDMVGKTWIMKPEGLTLQDTQQISN
jgi:phage shock protein PspC (stress-responsive transcriptional regulator)